MFEYKCYKCCPSPSQLVLFLHGHNSGESDWEPSVKALISKLKNAVIIVPRAPEISEKNPNKYQWFGLAQYDADDKRYQPQTSIAEIFNIYNLAGNKVLSMAQDINIFIDFIQKQYNIADADTYIVGFSQGAMLTIYTALNRNTKIAAAFALSGLTVDADLLAQNIKSSTPLYLLHGTADAKVQFKTFATSVKLLKQNHVDVHQHTYPNLAHNISEEEINDIAAIINNA